MTDWYTASGNPTQSSSVASNVLRSEYSSIAAAFSKMPALTGYNGLLVGVNSSGTALSTYSYPEILSALNAAELGANVTFLTINGTTITASTQFSGPGTGLTGTAAGLSIGGNATTATTANALNSANNYQVTNFTYTGTLTGSTGIMNIGSGQIYKDASGNVGIGTSSPITKLDVAGNGSFISTNHGATSTGAVIIRDYATDNSTGYVQWVDNANVNQLGAIGGISGGGLKFINGVTEAMRIDSSGNVGIGTTAPTEVLDVNGYIKTSSGIKFPDGTTQTTAGLGIGQTWQDVTTSRALGTTYTNSTGKPIHVCVSVAIVAGNAVQLSVGSVVVAQCSGNSATIIYANINAIVPNGQTYNASFFVGSSATLAKWSELR